MRGLFLKIFAIFWLAQSLIFVISTLLIVRQRFPTGNIVSEALDNNLIHNASAAVRAYESSGCAGFLDRTTRNQPAGAVLFGDHGNLLCVDRAIGPIPDQLLHLDRVDGRQVGNHFLWIVPVHAASGYVYRYVWIQPPLNRAPPRSRWALVHFAFPQLPVAIAVGGLTTFVLVLLFTRPIVRLRKAARSLAEGRLDARVDQSTSDAQKVQSDEFQGLVHDFNHMAERLESMVAAQRLLLRDVSHELRSPLSRLSVSLELVREDAPKELEPHFARIERETVRLNQLIGQLLTLSSLETRENTASFTHISLNELCEEIVSDARFEAQQRPCSVTLQQADNCTVRGNPELLRRAIENVVRNAIRYTEPNTHVYIRLEQQLRDGRSFAVVEVADEGPGIPEPDLEKIFLPFYRVDRARSSSTGGFGVGLAISERAVRLHGGTITAANQPSGGAIVRIFLPSSV